MTHEVHLDQAGVLSSPTLMPLFSYFSPSHDGFLSISTHQLSFSHTSGNSVMLSLVLGISSSFPSTPCALCPEVTHPPAPRGKLALTPHAIASSCYMLPKACLVVRVTPA